MAKKNKPRRRAVDPTMEETRLPFEFDQLLVERSPEARMQPKLKVHGSDDLWEREADANADSVLRALGGQTEPAELRLTPLVVGAAADATSGPVQRQEEEEEELLQAKRVGGGAPKLGAAAGVQIRALRGGGRPLPAALRSEFEAQFGRDFGRVRIHAESVAAEIAAGIGARAFTTGHDVVFASGEYRPESREGRRLLAHELTHVAQQTRSGASPPTGDAVQRKNANAPAIPRKALDTALKGDDDDVRDLTQSEVWPQLDVQARESATLMEHLLDGATLDGDEQAGIKVLTKARQQKRADDALEELDNRGKFGQLLDDYHGAEYRELLKLLSTAIKRRKVKALYLDAFIAMWWLNKAEEEAVVVLLEKSSGPDVAALLRENNRLGEFRSDIDDAGLAKRFEKKVGAGNAADFKVLKKQLMAIFTVRARKAVGTKTMSGAKLKKADVKRLLVGAASDLGLELTHYKEEVAAAVDKGNAAQLRKINNRFRDRIVALLKKNNTKIHEFGLELRWNKEFNRALTRSYARNWTRTDLNDVDAHLRKIPPQLLYGNKNLRVFSRGSTDPYEPSMWGESSFGEITLFKQVARGITTHEVGHQIHTDAKRIFKDFKDRFEWQRLTASELEESGVPEHLIAELDKHRSEEKTFSFVTLGGYSYHFEEALAKRPKEYWRCRLDFGFVSRYAKTDPKEDFAETFEAYLDTPEKDRKKAPKKFEFMHDEIFIRYWLDQEKERVVDRFMGIWAAFKLKIKDSRLRSQVWKSGTLPVKKKLEHRLNALATQKLSEVLNSKPRKHIPLEKWPESWKVAEGYFEVLREVNRFAAELSGPFERFKAAARSKTRAKPVVLRGPISGLMKELESSVARRFGKLVVKPRRLLLAGKKVAPRPWPSLATAIRESNSALSVVDGWESFFQRHDKARQGLNFRHRPKRGDLFWSPDQWENFDPFAKKLVGKFPVDSVNHKILVAAITSERRDAERAFNRQKTMLIELIQKGKRYRRGLLVEPKALVIRYRSKVRRRFNRVKHGRGSTKQKGKR